MYNAYSMTLSRREFLRLSTIAAGASMLPNFLLQPPSEGFNPLALNVGINLKQELLTNTDSYTPFEVEYNVGNQLVSGRRSNLTFYNGVNQAELSSRVADLVHANEKDGGYSVLDLGPGLYGGPSTSEHLGTANVWGARYPLVVSIDRERMPFDRIFPDDYNPHLGLHGRGESYGFGFSCQTDINLLPTGVQFDKVAITAPYLRPETGPLLLSAFNRVKTGGFLVLAPDPNVINVPPRLNGLLQFLQILSANGYSEAEITPLNVTAEEVYDLNEGQLGVVRPDQQAKVAEARGIGSLASGFLPWKPGIETVTTLNAYYYTGPPIDVFLIKKTKELEQQPAQQPQDMPDLSLEDLLKNPTFWTSLMGAGIGIGVLGGLGRLGKGGNNPTGTT